MTAGLLVNLLSCLKSLVARLDVTPQGNPRPGASNIKVLGPVASNIQVINLIDDDSDSPLKKRKLDK